MSILAIDPGPEESGWCLYEGRVLGSGVAHNDDVRELLYDGFAGHEIPNLLAIEGIASYGMAVGADVFSTCIWIGRFMECWHYPDKVRLVYRREVKQFLCGTDKAKDTNIRQALIDSIGPPGTKKQPGPTYGVSKHAWAALAVAVTVDGMMALEAKA